jgi:hypothetical protein
VASRNFNLGRRLGRLVRGLNDDGTLVAGSTIQSSVTSIATDVVTSTPTVDSAATLSIISDAVNTTLQPYDANLKSFVDAFTLPTSDGTANQVIITDGSGVLSFADQSGGGGGGSGGPAVTGSNLANELSTGTYTITDYDASYSYIITVSGGSYTRSGATISWTFPLVTADTTYYLTALTVSNGVISPLTTVNVTVQNITIADTAIIVSDFSATSSKGWY